MSVEMESILITGANAGIGKECARQLSRLPHTQRIVLACRNKDKAEAARTELMQHDASSTVSFEILIVDLSDIKSVKNAVHELSAPVDVVVMNAGGLGGEHPEKLTEEGVTSIFGSNILGHVALCDGLVAAKKLNHTAILAGSETARGLPFMHYPVPKLASGSVEEFKTICDGSFFGEEKDTKAMYTYTKCLGALWIGSAARQYPHIRMVTISPGATAGTSAADQMPPLVQFLRRFLLFPVMELLGNAHGLETGASRYVDAILDKEDAYQTGHFYASNGPNKVSGPVVDQIAFLDDFGNEEYQDHASAAIHSFL